MRSDGVSAALGAGGRLLVVGEAEAEGGGKPWMGSLSWGHEGARRQRISRHGCLQGKGTADTGYLLPFRRRIRQLDGMDYGKIATTILLVFTD